jgi:hypothetical protein
MSGPLQKRPAPISPSAVTVPVRELHANTWAEGDLIFVPDLGLQFYMNNAWHGLVYAGGAVKLDLVEAVEDHPVDHTHLLNRGQLTHQQLEQALATLRASVDSAWAPTLMLMGA